MWTTVLLTGPLNQLRILLTGLKRDPKPFVKFYAQTDVKPKCRQHNQCSDFRTPSEYS